MQIMYIFIAILAFGFLIAIHELGHFFAAKALGVKVNEFAIGMGPKLFKKQGKETLYTLRALPIGGFCAMDGQDELVDNPRAFTSQKRWRRVVILLAGSLFNFIAAFILIVLLTSGIQGFTGTTLTGIADGFPNQGEQGLMAGDTLHSINGERLFYIQDFQLFMHLAEMAGNREVDLVIIRDGRRIELNNFPLERREFPTADGQTSLRFGFYFNLIEAGFAQNLRFSAYTAMNYVRMIRISLAQIFTGQAGRDQISGVVGIVDVMQNAGLQAPTFIAGLTSIAGITALIGVNLAVMNLLPIPALDGGRILFIAISWVVEKVSRKDLDPKYEGYIHTGTMVLLFGLMIFLFYNDIVNIVTRFQN